MSNVRRDAEGRKGKQTLYIAGAGLRGGPAEQLPGAPTCNGRYVTGIIGSMGLVNLGYHTRKKCSDNYPQFGHGPSTIFASPIVGRRSLNNTDFKQWRTEWGFGYSPPPPRNSEVLTKSNRTAN